MSRSSVSVVVVTRDGSPWIEPCLGSTRYSQHVAEVIVVDNGSTDDTVSLVRESPGVTCVPLGRNLGFGKANNMGMARALQRGADFVFLLNQDATVEADTIDKLVQFAERHPEFGILSPLHLDGNGRGIDGNFAAYLLHGARIFYSDLYFGRVQSVYEVPFVNAAAWLVTRRCLERVGGFDPLFFLYREDDDLCRRAIQHGFKIGVIPAALAYHCRGLDARVQVSRVDRLRRRSCQFSGSAILDLKEPTHSFVSQLVLLAAKNIYTVAHLLQQGDGRGLAAWLLAMARISLCLPVIWRHRAMSDRPATHWL